MARSPKPWAENAHDQAASPNFAQQIPRNIPGAAWAPVLNERPELSCILEAGMAKAMQNWRRVWGVGVCEGGGGVSVSGHSPRSCSFPIYSPIQSKVLPNKVPDKAQPSQAPSNPLPTQQAQAFQFDFPTAIVIHTPSPQEAGSSPCWARI